jgi:hypothetical protein
MTILFKLAMIISILIYKNENRLNKGKILSCVRTGIIFSDFNQNNQEYFYS